jgi:hypothetical protein
MLILLLLLLSAATAGCWRTPLAFALTVAEYNNALGVVVELEFEFEFEFEFTTLLAEVVIV